jgi:hypothetical protein
VTTRARAILIVIPLLTAAIGIATATLVGAPVGAGHSCPAGAPDSACRYPPDTARWDLVWTAGGLAAGALASVTIALARRRRPSAEHETIAGPTIDGGRVDQG